MRKILFMTALLALLATMCGAFASENMINPYFQEANNLPEVPMTFSMRAANKVSVDVSFVQEPSLTNDTIFSASASGGNGSYRYCFYILNPNETSAEYTTGDPHAFRAVSSVSTFRYRFVVPGTYLVLAYAMDTQDNVWDAYATLQFTIKSSTVQTTDQKVQALVEECLAAGCETDYEKALWFHDWLTDNAYYDQTYSYYSADGVLVRGTGVCDSYSKAYYKLLSAAGIQVERVTNIDHAWTLVKLGGEWHHIDPTWDDPIPADTTLQTEKLSGNEYHMYFGLPDDVMRADRSFVNYSSTTEANGIDYNYFLQSGDISIWTDPLVEQISDSLTESGYSFVLDLPTYYTLENGKMSIGKECVVYTLCAYDMNRRNWDHGSVSVPIDFSYDMSEQLFSGIVEFSPSTTLDLPDSLEIIDEEAFAGGNFMEILIPETVSAIESGAFSDNPMLWRVAIPDTVLTIGENAFKGSDNVTILCSQDSAAHAFAVENGIKFRLQ